MGKANKIYICAADPNAGSSVIALGVLGTLSRAVDRVGFFKPVGEGPGDPDVVLMKAAYRLAPSAAAMCPLAINEARELMARGQEAAMLDRICTAYDAIRGSSEMVVLEGISHQRSLSLFDLDINATIAARLGAPVVLVAGAMADGQAMTPEALATSVISAWSSFQEKGCDLVGVIVNRVVGDDFVVARDRYFAALEKDRITVLGALPSLDFLGLPRLAQIVEVLDAEVLSGRDYLSNIACKTLIAAMEPRHFLKWLQVDNTLVITPGDRDDVLLAVALMQTSSQHRRIAGLILTGGLRPDPAVLELLGGQRDLRFPILFVQTDTFTTATAVNQLDVRIGPGDDDKIYAVAAAVQRYVGQSKLWERLAVAASRPVGAGAFLDTIIEKAKGLKKSIVFPEGEEPRTVRAAARLSQGGILRPILLGSPGTIKAYAENEGLSLAGIELLDPRACELREAYAETVHELRRHRRGGITREYARQWLDESPIHYGTVMVQRGDADGLVAGAIHATGDTIRPAFQIIGVRPEVGVASSVFFMVFKDRVLVYGDCAIIPNPNAQELAGIAVAAARTARAFGLDPRVAMLSYSTGASGAGGDVDKVTEATRLVRERDPVLLVDGPMQYDAAIDPEVGRRKQPDSPVAGRANVFIFPDLDAGNIAYKAVQRMSGALAVGPVMQGMNKPVNDLSRGCSVDDIYYVAAITAIQAAG